ncbi:BRO-N domain-containing protein [Isoalcanivorax beigongshangi]|uniref:Bro-N domain-containing protein n=1 Tax=Isoalcanivorax beigongshangi TaxID=3238810 RepID=A0ABV4AFG8_9GAMM
MKALAFHSTQFDIIDHEGQPWLQAAQIAKALGYATEDAVSRIYRRNADEFSTCMTQTVKLTASGNLRKEARIFSLRGAHLLAMFSRTGVAKEFRRWVLDVLEGAADSQGNPGRAWKGDPERHELAIKMASQVAAEAMRTVLHAVMVGDINWRCD